MSSIENHIEQLGNEVDYLRRRVEILRALKSNMDAAAADVFTRHEVNQVKKKLEDVNQEQMRKTRLFKEKLDIYENRVQKIETTLEKRSGVIDAVCDATNMAEEEDIMEIFSSEHCSLTTELEKSVDMLNTS